MTDYQEEYSGNQQAWLTEFYTAGFGLPEDTELLRLRGGFMLGELVKNMWDAVNNETTTKYFAYSAVSPSLLS